MVNNKFMPFLAFTILISAAQILGMDVSSSGGTPATSSGTTPAASSGPQRTTPADLERLRKDGSTFFSALPKELVQMVGPQIDDTADVAQIIDQANKIEDLFQNPELKKKLSFKEDYIGKLMHDKFGENINMSFGVLQAPIIFDAIDTDFIGIVQLLLAAGVSIETKNRSGGTILMRAISRNKPDMVQLLIEKGANLSNPYLLAVSLRSKVNPKIFDMLVAAGAKIDPNLNLLHEAVNGGKIEAIKKLISLGLDINKTDEEGKTLLFYAAEQGYPDAVQELLRSGAGSDINRKDTFFNATPFWIAAYTSIGMREPNAKKRIIETAQLLLEAGADPTIPAGYLSSATGLESRSNKLPEEIAIPEIKELIEKWKKKHSRK